MQFLMGMNPFFDHVKDQILLMEPLPSLDKVYSMLSKIEKQNDVSNLKSIKIASYSTANFSVAQKANQQPHRDRYGIIDKSNLKSDYCNGTTCAKKTNFKLLGYPEWRDMPKLRGKLVILMIIKHKLIVT